MTSSLRPAASFPAFMTVITDPVTDEDAEIVVASRADLPLPSAAVEIELLPGEFFATVTSQGEFYTQDLGQALTWASTRPTPGAITILTPGAENTEFTRTTIRSRAVYQ